MILFFFVLGFAITTGSPILTFWDWPSFLIVIGGTITLLIAKYGKIKLPVTADIASSGVNFSLFSGAIGNIIGVIQILQNLSDPAHIGPALAISLCSVFYSLVLASFFNVFKNENNISTKDGISGAVLGISTLAPLAMTLFSLQQTR